MATCPESDLTTFASDGLPGFDESYSLNVLNGSANFFSFWEPLTQVWLGNKAQQC